MAGLLLLAAILLGICAIFVITLSTSVIALNDTIAKLQAQDKEGTRNESQE